MFSAASSTLLIKAGYTSFSFSALEILGFTMIISVAILVVYWGLTKLQNIAMGRELASYRRSQFADSLRKANNSIAANQIYNSELLDNGDKVLTIDHWLKE